MANKKTKPTGTNLAFENKLWAIADALRNNMKASDPENPDEYHSMDIFWMPNKACLQYPKASALLLTMGMIVDDNGVERIAGMVA